jgi:vancomycin resistance protein YoaR
MKQQLGTWLLTGLVLLQTGMAGFAGYAVMDAHATGTLPAGMHVGSVDIGGLAPEPALRLVEEHPVEAGIPGVLRIVLGEDSYPLDATSLAIAPHREDLLAQLRAFSGQTPWARMLAGFSHASAQTADPLALPLQCDSRALEQAAAGLSSVWNRDAVPAGVSLQGETLMVEEGVPGRKLDVPGFAEWMVRELRSGPMAEAGVLTLHAKPDVLLFSERGPTASEYAEMRRAGAADVLFSEGGSGDAGQAAALLSGRLLLPGEDFSLRAWMNGGGYAPITADGPSRVATAVFRSLLSVRGMTVKERVPSPYATNYAPPGQEAVLSDGLDDLAMRNEGGNPVLLMAVAEGESLRVLAFSRVEGASGTLFSDVTQTTEPPLIQSLTRELPPGDVRVISAGRAGIQVSVYRVDAEGKTFLHADQYPPQNRILEVGMQPDPRLAK